MREAVILAGGKGTRLWPLTATKPKPLIPLCGKTLIDYIVEWLSRNNYTRFLVAAKYLGEQIVEHFRGRGEVEVYLLDSRDTADAVRLLSDRIRGRDFLVAMGDVVCNADFNEFWEAHVGGGHVATIMLREVDNPRPYGLVLVDEEGRIRLFIEKPDSLEMYVLSIAYSRRLGRIAYSNLVNAGFYMLNEKVLELLRENPALMDWGRHVFPYMLENNIPLHAWIAGPGSYWEDVGRPSSYLAAMRSILSGHVRGYKPPGEEREPRVYVKGEPLIEGRIVPPAYIGPGAVIENDAIIGPYACIEAGAVVKRGARVRNSAIWSRSVVGENTVVEDSVVAENTVIGDTAVVAGSVIGEAVEIPGSSHIAGERIWRA